MLTIAEEILLLVLDDDSGRLRNLPVHSLRNAISGALLMDLALNDRIDTDLQQLVVVSAAPLDEPALDFALERLAEADLTRSADHWVEHFAEDSDGIQAQLIDRLVSRGILARQEGKLLWVIGMRRYPAIDGRPHREVKRRIMDVLYSDRIPDPRDIVIICLADACALLDSLLRPTELARLRPRIAQVAKLDLIGQSVTRVVRQLQDATRGAQAKWFS